MKTKILFTVILMQFGFFTYAQKPKHANIKALKVAQITTQLSLTTDEAEKFWPIYNAYEEKQSALKSKKMQLFKQSLSNEKLENLSVDQANSILTDFETLEEEMFQNRKKFQVSLKSVLSSVKIIKLKKAEDDFNKTLLNQYKRKKN